MRGPLPTVRWKSNGLNTATTAADNAAIAGRPRRPINRPSVTSSPGPALKRAMEVVEQRESPLQALFVSRMRVQNSFEQLPDPRRLGSSEFLILQIDVVHDLGDALHRAVADGERGDQCFECTTVADVRVVAAGHVEGDLAGPAFPRLRIDEAEAGLGIEKAAHQPRRGDAIDFDALAGDPGGAARNMFLLC